MMTHDILTKNRTLLALLALAFLIPGPSANGSEPSISKEPVCACQGSPADDKTKERPYSEGFKAVRIDGKWGFVNMSGEQVIPPEYDYVRSFHDGLAMVKRSGKWGYIDWFGDVLIPIEFDEVTNFKDGYAFVKKDGKAGLMDMAGNVTFDYDRMKLFTFPAIWLDVKPSFNGGDPNTFAAWVNSMLRYPDVARLYETQGTVYFTFSIDIDGSVTDIKITRGAGLALNLETVRVVSLSPKWTPGMYDGKPFKSSFGHSVVFQMKRNITK